MDEAIFQEMARKRVVYGVPGMEDVPACKDILFKSVDDLALKMDLYAPITFMNHPSGMHAFDMLNDNDRSREIICMTLEFIRTHL